MIIRTSIIALIICILSGCQTSSSAPRDSYSAEDVPVGVLQLLVNKQRADVVKLIGQPTKQYEKSGYVIWEYNASTSRVIMVQFPRMNPGVVSGVIEGFNRDAMLRIIQQTYY